MSGGRIQLWGFFLIAITQLFRSIQQQPLSHKTDKGKETDRGRKRSGDDGTATDGGKEGLHASSGKVHL